MYRCEIKGLLHIGAGLLPFIYQWMLRRKILQPACNFRVGERVVAVAQEGGDIIKKGTPACVLEVDNPKACLVQKQVAAVIIQMNATFWLRIDSLQ